MTKLAKKPTIEPTDDIRSERWRVVIFLKDGRSCVSPRIFSSEHAATVVGERHAERCAAEPKTMFSVHGVRGFFFMGAQFSHFIPIPWGQTVSACRN